MNILLVDDETCVLKVIGDFLTDCGHAVTLAGNGQEGLEILHNSPGIDLVVSDIRMPQIDGFEFLRRVLVQFPGLPVILITGHGDEKIAVNAFQDGAYGYLKKPICLEALSELIDKIEAEQCIEARLVEEYKGIVMTNGIDPMGVPVQDENVSDKLHTIMDNFRAIENGWNRMLEHLNLCSPTQISTHGEIDTLLESLNDEIATMRELLCRLSNDRKI